MPNRTDGKRAAGRVAADRAVAARSQTLRRQADSDDLRFLVRLCIEGRRGENFEGKDIEQDLRKRGTHFNPDQLRTVLAEFGVKAQPTARSRPVERDAPTPTDLRLQVRRFLESHPEEHFGTEDIAHVLQESGASFTIEQLRTVLAEFRLKAQPTTRSRPVKAKARTPAENLVATIAVTLYKVETDAVGLRVGHGLAQPPVVRIDKVLGGSRNLWVSFWIADGGEAQRRLPQGPAWELLMHWRLPLVRPDAPEARLPTLGVARLQNPMEAAELAAALLTEGAGDVAAITLDFEECEPMEAERRLLGADLVHRSTARASAKLPQGNCLVCGMPLSDPTSVKLGIGPYCQARYQPDVVRALADRGRRRTHLIGGRTAKSWATHIRESFGPLQQTGIIGPSAASTDRNRLPFSCLW